MTEAQGYAVIIELLFIVGGLFYLVGRDAGKDE